jgi:formylglycine-generating enzyme
MNRIYIVLFLLCAICFLSPRPASAVVTIDTVPVGNPGNAADTAVMFDGTTGYGGVGYAYDIGKYEVTVGQYTAFLNAVAATDAYVLYNTAMGTQLNMTGISRSGVSGSYSYSVIGSANNPITVVSWGDAARFCNWLHNGQPTGLQNVSTTEDGAYPLNGATSIAALDAISRKAGAKWFIPSENEWYKAAYHKNDGLTGNYWDYPTRTNSPPISVQPPGSGAPTPSNTANVWENDFVSNGYNDGYAVTGSTSVSNSQNYLTDVGAYTASTSPYGTFDQGGNVWEWNEAVSSGSQRGIRGGSFVAGLMPLFPVSLNSRDREYFIPTFEVGDIGFRVASIPEPSTAVLAVLACGLMWWERKRLK